MWWQNNGRNIFARNRIHMTCQIKAATQKVGENVGTRVDVLWCWNMADDGKPCLDGDMHLCEVYFRADMICFLDTSRPETAVNLLFQCSERQNAKHRNRLDATWTRLSQKNDFQWREAGHSEQHMNAALNWQIVGTYFLFGGQKIQSSKHKSFHFRAKVLFFSGQNCKVFAGVWMGIWPPVHLRVWNEELLRWLYLFQWAWLTAFIPQWQCLPFSPLLSHYNT